MVKAGCVALVKASKFLFVVTAKEEDVLISLMFVERAVSRSKA